MKHVFAKVALVAVLALGAPRTGLADGPVVVVELSGALDAERVRAAVGRELGMTAVAPGDPRAASAAVRVTITATDRMLTVTSGRTTRTVALPADRARVEENAVLLAGNVGRDEAKDLAAALRRPARPADASVPPPPPLPPPPPPTDGQRAALAMLREEVVAYEQGARAYRETVASIVKAQYEVKKQRVLAGLDREIAAEKAALEKAQATAIRRLEELLERHTEGGPEIATAMLRLAALYDDRGSADDAIRLYRRVIREAPRHPEIATAHYLLGHALADAGRHAEAQQAWRGLVCHNLYPYDPAREASLPTADGPSYVEVYPDDCVALPATRAVYAPEVWWQIGNWELDGLDPTSGRFAYNRAASAYARALRWERSPIHSIALFKYAWTLFKQQRHALATKAFVAVLQETDEAERRGGGRFADLRKEATAFIAGSLATLDFVGPPALAPFVARPDVLDVFPDPAKAEKALHVAIDRANDPTIIPQDQAWTIAIHRALAVELQGIGQTDNAVELYEGMLRRWPTHPTAPATEDAIAEAYEQAARPERALAARTRLARYVGTTAWVDANKDDPAALRDAERLARRGLRQAAVSHTTRARAALDAADRTSDRRRQTMLLGEAARAYGLAARAWEARFPDRDDPEDTEARRYWHADALHKVARLEARLGTGPSPAAIEAASRAAILARDAAENERFVDNAAFFAVDLADLARDREGPARREVRFEGSDPRTRVVAVDPIPPAVLASMAAREAYVRAVPPARDREGRGPAYRYWVAETYFLYGRWDEARARFEPLWKERCGVDALGAKAWERLVTMAAKSRDEARALALAAAVDPSRGGRSCDAAIEAPIAGPIVRQVALARADERRAAAATAADTRAAWREVASLYEAARRGAGADEAAEAMIGEAEARRRAGEHDAAIALYGTVIAGERTRALGDAYDALAAMQVALFDPQHAAQTYDRLARDPRADGPRRITAARNAIALHATLGDRAPVNELAAIVRALHAPADEIAAAEYRAASLSSAALERWVGANASNAAARRLLVEASYAVATAKRGTPEHRAWLGRTVAAWDALAKEDAAEAQRAPYVDHAAEAAFTALDEEIRAGFEAPARHLYGPRTADVLAAFRKNAEEAERLDRRLDEEVIRKYRSAAWVPAAIARQGGLFETLRAGLYDTTRVDSLGPSGRALAASLRSAGNAAAADQLEDTAADAWRTKKQRELDATDEVMIRRYAAAVAQARKLDLGSAWTTRATARLAWFAELLGDVKVGAFVTKVPDPTTGGATMLRYAPGTYVRPGVAAPAPGISSEARPAAP